MSRTTTEIRGKKFPKSKKTQRYSTPKNAPKDAKGRKFFGFTSGTHSHFDELNDKQKDGRSYPVKGKDFIKYDYGNLTKKENRSKHYRKEID